MINGNVKITKPKSVSLKRLDGGLNLRDLEMKIGDIQSPSMLNVMADGIGGLTKRHGQMKVYATSLGATAVNAITYYKDSIVIAWGTGLYTQSSSNQPVSIKTGITDAKGMFINYNSKLYYFNGHEALIYDGTTVTNLTDNTYTPYVAIDLKPDGTQGGTVTPDVDDINLISPYFTKTFIGDGTSDKYVLNITNIDEVTEVKVNGFVQDPTYYVVDLIGASITFTAGHIPPVNLVDPSNVEIKMKKIDSTRINQILNCTIVTEYESKLFLTGNPNFANKYWVMGLTDRQDATYWPELGYNNTIGGNDDAITGFTEFYNKLIIFKEHTTHALTYVSLNNELTTSLKKISGTIGCDMPGSIQTVNNNPIFCNSYGGLHLIVSTLIENEKNVVPISALINGGVRQGLLDEAIEELTDCASVDFDHKYRLCVGNKEYVWDYSLQAYGGSQETLHFFLNDNVNARQYLVLGTELYYGRRATGELVKFITAQNDFGTAINAYFTSKLYDFGNLTHLKNIKRVYYASKPGTATTINVSYTDDTGTSLGADTTFTTAGGWTQCTFVNFTWSIARFSKPVRLKPNIHNREYFQIKFSNNGYNENLSLLDLIVEFTPTKLIK